MEVAEAERDALQAEVDAAVGDRSQAEELATNWASWDEQMEAEMQKGESTLSRQVLAKALAGAPIYVMPMPAKRTWAFLGLASYEGVIRGAVRPGAIATFIQDEADLAPLVDRGAPPKAVREWLAAEAAFMGGEPMPKALFKPTGRPFETKFTPPRRPDGTVDEVAIAGMMVPEWARGKARGWAHPKPTKRGGVPKPISGGSDVPYLPVGSGQREVQHLQGQVGAPM
jgi:hypothetical protein